MQRKTFLAPLLAAGLAAGLAACGGTGSSTPTAGGSASPAAASTSASALAVAHTSLGSVLVDSQGRTVYMLTADSANHSTCSASCLAYWPSVAVPGRLPQHVPGVTATVGSTALPSGGRTLTAGGWPLYTFVKDTKPGDVSGEGVVSFGGTWYAVSPSGQPVKTPSGGSSGSGSSSGGGYGY